MEKEINIFVTIGDLLAVVPRQLTCGKAFSLAQHGLEPTGFVLRSFTTGEMCIVEGGTVRKLSNKESQDLMRP